MKAKVLQEQDTPTLKRLNGTLCFRPDAITHRSDWHTDQFGQMHRNWGKAQTLHHSPVWSPKVGHQYDTGSLCAQGLDGRDGSANPGIVTDRTLVHRHIEVNPDEHPLVMRVDVSDGLLVECDHRQPLFWMANSTSPNA